MPHKYKTDGKIGKKVLRDVLYRYVPKKMMDRPKKGFGVPIDQWIRNGQLREWAEDMLNDSHIRQQGILNPQMVKHVWETFKKRRKEGGKDVVVADV